MTPPPGVETPKWCDIYGNPVPTATQKYLDEVWTRAKRLHPKCRNPLEVQHDIYCWSQRHPIAHALLGIVLLPFGGMPSGIVVWPAIVLMAMEACR